MMFALWCSGTIHDERHLVHKADGERQDEIHWDMEVTLEIYDSQEKENISLKRTLSKNFILNLADLSV